MRIYFSEKVIFTEAARSEMNLLLWVVKSLCLPKLKSTTVYLYDFSSVN